MDLLSSLLFLSWVFFLFFLFFVLKVLSWVDIVLISLGLTTFDFRLTYLWGDLGFRFLSFLGGVIDLGTLIEDPN